MKRQIKFTFFRITMFLFLVSVIGINTGLRAELPLVIIQNQNLEVTQDTKEDAGKQESESGLDWLEIIMIIGYLGGVFVLLPLVIYTNSKENLFIPNADNQDKIDIIEDLTEEQHNQRSAEILERIESKLTSFKAEDGSEMLTITNGFQARFTKHGLDYIRKRLNPTDPEIIDRMNEFSEVYKDRARRAFTGSRWVIISSIGIGVLFFFTGGVSTFLFIHALGLVFYILSSRTTFYGIEKRLKYFGGGSGIMSTLFLGKGTKYYVKSGGGSWKRDWETEGQMAIIKMFLLVVIALFLGFLAAFLGVVNFIINYSTSFILPFQSIDKWYERKILQKPMA